MTAPTATRDLAEILADLADFTVARTGATAITLYHELEDVLRARLVPLPESETERLAAQAGRDARTMAPPVPNVTQHSGYTVRAVINHNPKVPGLLEAWWVALENPERGAWVTWNAYAGDPAGSQPGRLSYDGGHYFGSPDPQANKKAAYADLAVRAGTMAGVAILIAQDVLSYDSSPENRRMASRLRKWAA